MLFKLVVNYNYAVHIGSKLQLTAIPQFLVQTNSVFLRSNFPVQTLISSINLQKNAN